MPDIILEPGERVEFPVHASQEFGNLQRVGNANTIGGWPRRLTQGAIEARPQKGQTPMTAHTLRQRCLALTSILLALVVLTPWSASANAASDGIIAPARAVEQTGHTYGEWSAAWWQYVFSLPSASNPLFDQTGADCQVGQHGPVFYLVGVINVSETAHRSECTVPAGKTLFFPILNNECSTVEPPPFFGSDRPSLAACNHFFMDNARDLAVEIDGVAVHQLEQYNVCPKADLLCEQVPIISFNLPSNNVLGVPAGSGLSLGSGYYLLVAPLQAGSHSIHFHGTVPNANFTLDITYDPLVVK
jgi:hypothetical protein